VIAALEAAIRKVVASPDFIAGCERLGARPSFKDAADFGRQIATEDVELAKLMEIIGLKK
jgi:tripartite-type tricarboxylate transporter receptor subunit TctC